MDPLRTFKSRDAEVMLWEALVIPRFDYCFQLYNPPIYSVRDTTTKNGTKIISEKDGMNGLNYWKQLQSLNINSLERRKNDT